MQPAAENQAAAQPSTDCDHCEVIDAASCAEPVFAGSERVDVVQGDCR
jgi:hypothetical protein